jgi:hypothetical protein
MLIGTNELIRSDHGAGYTRHTIDATTLAHANLFHR